MVAVEETTLDALVETTSFEVEGVLEDLGETSTEQEFSKSVEEAAEGGAPESQRAPTNTARRPRQDRLLTRQRCSNRQHLERNPDRSRVQPPER